MSKTKYAVLHPLTSATIQKIENAPFRYHDPAVIYEDTWEKAHEILLEKAITAVEVAQQAHMRAIRHVNAVMKLQKPE